ncbi:NAD(P)/FAD-dependent oxidoreductase [Sinomonas sp. G460-2]|uniref:NAD(P)/FAD-dependent oxidoreductase n=1 Tax=Sinomonas sp. G460-2 TaxID=3393464 RepID=UPI0039F01956
MGSDEHVVVVGAGHAGVQLVDSLRAGGYEGPLTLLSREACLPYQRPPLSKDFIAAGSAAEPLLLRGASFFDDAGVDARWGVSAERLLPSSREVLTSTGERLAYTSLVLATGAESRPLRVPGEDLAGVFRLRTLDDARAASAALEGARRAVVVGAGFIGLEFAAGARARGMDVTLVSPTERPLRRAVSRTVSVYLTERHAHDGERFELGDGVAAFFGTGSDDGGRRRVSAVATTSGREIPADLVVVGVGVRPASGLAAAAGLELADDGGIAVDGNLRASDPAISVIGDCASFPSVHAGRCVRLESVQNATDQARHAAAVILGKDPGPYRELPWFWSHQGATKVQIAGLRRGDASTVVRGDVAAGRFSVFTYYDGELVCVESVNSPADHLAARRLLGAGRSVAPADAGDPAFDLKAYSRAAPAAV